MPNVISYVFAIILAVFVLFFVPTYQTFEKEEDLAYLNTYQAVTDFVDNVRTKGFITPSMYEDFQQKLHLGDVLYDVEVVHKHKVYTPIYTDPNDINSFTGEYTVQYEEFHWEQIEPYLFGSTAQNQKDRIYKLEEGDFFEVYVENKSKLKSTMLLDYITGNFGNEDAVVISIPYGGMVLNEDY